MARITKQNGSTTITNDDGRISGNIAQTALNGPNETTAPHIDPNNWGSIKDSDHWSYQATLEAMVGAPEGSTMVHIDDIPEGHYAVEYWKEEAFLANLDQSGSIDPVSQDPQLGIIVGPFPTAHKAVEWATYSFLPDPDTFDDMVIMRADRLKLLTESKFIIISTPNSPQ